MSHNSFILFENTLILYDYSLIHHMEINVMASKNCIQDFNINIGNIYNCVGDFMKAEGW